MWIRDRVSSDSDFTRLATRLREGGNLVIGFGAKKTPKPFVGACDKFVYTEILREESGAGKPVKTAQKTPKSATMAQLKQDSRLVSLLRDAVEDSADDSGWMPLRILGRNVANRAPEFDPRNYGFRKLGDLVRKTGLFEIDERPSKDSPTGIIYVRDKRNRTG